ncbi:pro-resilin-like [Neodiprion virginianus]|uniref:pro-resilin-like n=1 Tax=Neodiprion virginianus TaxID=2961670 RepID=UPI001EE71B2E|nr:pro-resilin-like [Neodiprion virginianus]
MKVFILLSLSAVALASLEPAGYRPPGSASPSARYLPASPISNQYLPASHHSSNSISNQYLPASQHSSNSISSQYLPASRYSSAPSNQYLPANKWSQVPAVAPSNQYLPASPSSSAPWASSASSQSAPWANSASSSASRWAAPSSQYLPAAQNSVHKSSISVPSNVYIPASSHGSSSSYSSHSNAAPSSHYLPANAGYRYAHQDDESAPAKYEFEYEVKDEPSGNDFGHHESRDGDNTRGVYTVVLPDGRKQIVHYEADQEGYKPRISYEEPKQGYNGGYNRQGGYAHGHPQGPY